MQQSIQEQIFEEEKKRNFFLGKMRSGTRNVAYLIRANSSDEKYLEFLRALPESPKYVINQSILNRKS